MKTYDIAVIGGGIIGLATSYKISELYPNLKTVIIEKEHSLGMHQSSRNSGVVHSGVYYKPGSSKALNCTRGKLLLSQFCGKHSIDYKVCGKLIVASYDKELSNLKILHERAAANGIETRLLKAEELKEIEPYLKGIAGIHIPSVAVIKFADVVRKLSELLITAGKDINLNAKVLGIKKSNHGFVIETSAGEISAKYIVNTAGLFCDQIAEMGMGQSPIRIIPFRGEYYELKEEARKYCNALIYPVPNPEYPFLGVHVTKMIDGKVECGPNAVLALSREGYSWSKFKLSDTYKTLTYGGFIKFAVKNLSTGIYEVYRSLNKKAFLESIQVLIPEIKESDLIPGSSGVRAQAILPDGKLVDDFFILEGTNQLHVLNAPSPAATSCLSIAESIVQKIYSQSNHS